MAGLAGADEADAFGSLTEVPIAITEQLIAKCAIGLVPAAATGDFKLFASSLYRYGRLSGELRRAAGRTLQWAAAYGPRRTDSQPGPFGRRTELLGTAIFVALPSQKAAEELAAQLQVSSDAVRGSS